MDVYIAFVVGLVLGACVTLVAICMAAAAELVEEDLPEDHECTRHLNGGRCSFDGCGDRDAWKHAAFKRTRVQD